MSVSLNFPLIFRTRCLSGRKSDDHFEGFGEAGPHCHLQVHFPNFLVMYNM